MHDNNHRGLAHTTRPFMVSPCVKPMHQPLLARHTAGAALSPVVYLVFPHPQMVASSIVHYCEYSNEHTTGSLTKGKQRCPVHVRSTDCVLRVRRCHSITSSI